MGAPRGLPLCVILVAGAGIEPASGGYEPPEVPLLYPAIAQYTTNDITFKYCAVDNLVGCRFGWVCILLNHRVGTSQMFRPCGFRFMSDTDNRYCG